MKHTIGNWNQSLNTLSKNGQRVIQNEDEVFIAYVQTEDTGEIEAEANAKLIVAAPKLLEALIALEKALPNDGTWNYAAAMANAREIIKKATE